MPPRPSTIDRKLIEWFGREGRHFPWRYKLSPYRLLISEILLQQTFADKVIPAFIEIVHLYPSFSRLSKADLRKLNRIIKPLGLHYRGETLRRAALFIRSEFYGRLPCDYRLLLKIPGVGQYTANSILCHCFNHRVIPMDTNIDRVVARLFGKTYPVSTAFDRQQIKNICDKISCLSRNCKVLHFAFLDFAYSICKYNEPLCEICMFKRNCDYCIRRD